jgi:hypothetical protein
MSITIQQTKTALTPNLTASFLAAGGTAPYVYSVQGGGAGGSINAVTGIYTAPATVNLPPNSQIDTILVTDDNGDTATATIMVGSALDMLLDVIQKFMGLDNEHIYYYNQKGFQPENDSLYIVLKIVNLKPYSNRRFPAGVNGGGEVSGQTVNTAALIDVNIFSRSMEAVYRQEEVLMALKSFYSQNQQVANSFKLPSIPNGFVDISEQDGAAILFRFVCSISVLYSKSLKQDVDYFDGVLTPEITLQP